jgi:tripartite ATP-independent transporter DctM subunit
VVAVVMGPLADISVGDILYGMTLPGLVMACLYLVYIAVRSTLDPRFAPAIPPAPDDPTFVQKLWISARNLVPPVILIFAVLGSILLGWASPTEAAAIGAIASVLLTILYGNFNLKAFYEAIIKTLKVTAMIMTVLLAGTLFTGVFIGAGGINTANRMIGEMNLTPWMLLGLMMAIIFIAGFFLDWISIVLIFVPIFTPLIKLAGFDPVWFCVLFLIMIQTSYLTPPMAPAIFYLRAVAPPEITIQHMYRGVVPFILLQVVTLILVMIFPILVTWLPTQMLQLR